MNETLTKEQIKTIFSICRQSIESKLSEKYEKTKVEDFPLLHEKRGVFVTLKINERLRGCIGNLFTEEELHVSLKDMARSSAFSDPRFSALTKDEYQNVDIEVSILSPMEKITNIDEIQIGTHGIVVSKGYNKAVFLPQVAVEQKWDRDEFLSNCCLKAYLPPNAYKDKDIIIEVFTADIFDEKELD